MVVTVETAKETATKVKSCVIMFTENARSLNLAFSVSAYLRVLFGHPIAGAVLCPF